ncbi:hypothetical protein FA15DRAFT_660703 [Coprinopsis marcescibilis]|uniref:Uncharacterized protein n=1 Tax=Coprinopsis marcescibilis TaxID=230819 RepID=A0A5C3KE72_COPMA|nr:hypothetical protein FA15DRAFT_660703 [Coprinopsis marcescibilis]
MSTPALLFPLHPTSVPITATRSLSQHQNPKPLAKYLFGQEYSAECNSEDGGDDEPLRQEGCSAASREVASDEGFYSEGHPSEHLEESIHHFNPPENSIHSMLELGYSYDTVHSDYLPQPPQVAPITPSTRDAESEELPLRSSTPLLLPRTLPLLPSLRRQLARATLPSSPHLALRTHPLISMHCPTRLLRSPSHASSANPKAEPTDSEDPFVYTPLESDDPLGLDEIVVLVNERYVEHAFMHEMDIIRANLSDLSRLQRKVEEHNARELVLGECLDVMYDRFSCLREKLEGRNRATALEFLDKALIQRGLSHILPARSHRSSNSSVHSRFGCTWHSPTPFVQPSPSAPTCPSRLRGPGYSPSRAARQLESTGTCFVPSSHGGNTV